jgi:hypothetical protein
LPSIPQATKVPTTPNNIGRFGGAMAALGNIPTGTARDFVIGSPNGSSGKGFVTLFIFGDSGGDPGGFVRISGGSCGRGIRQRPCRGRLEPGRPGGCLPARPQIDSVGAWSRPRRNELDHHPGSAAGLSPIPRQPVRKLSRGGDWNGDGYKDDCRRSAALRRGGQRRAFYVTSGPRIYWGPRDGSKKATLPTCGWEPRWPPTGT